MARWPRATWQPVSTCSGTLRPIAVTLHHQAGTGNPAGVYESRRVSAHFWIPKAGAPIQHVDTGVQAWHGIAHNGYSIGVETEGCGAPPHAEPLTENQLNLFAELMKWAHATHGIPLQLSEAVTQPGLNYHRCRGGPATGCPCDVRVNARAEILRRAGSVTPGPTPPPQPPPPTPGPGPTKPPAFPLPGGWYFGPRSGPAESVSGYAAPYGGPGGSAGLKTWQARMAARGWAIAADGFYGDQTAQVARQFQTEKRIAGGADGLIGINTWNAAWTTAVT